MEDEDEITIPFKRCTKSKKNCIICKSTTPLVVIPSEAKLQVFVKRGLIIQGQVRCCRKHLNGRYFIIDEIDNIREASDVSTLSRSEITELLNDLRAYGERGLLDFETPGALSDIDYRRLTGISADDFDDLFGYAKAYIRSTRARGSRTCLAILLMKLRTGLSHAVLSTLFGISRRTIGKAIDSARSALMKDFVPGHLGLEHMSREDFINMHTTDLAKNIFSAGDDVAILVADGTYMYIEKSCNYSFQRRTFSVHKGRPLVKPMMLVSTTGYILEVFGPYLADGKNNDANILNSLLNQRRSALLDWLWPEDLLVLDRGFRDSLDTLQEYNLVPKMPSLLRSGSQLDTLSANESRLVTKIRWVVESVNGMIKQWKMLGQVIPNTQIPYIGDYVRIVSALCNAYKPPRKQAASADDQIIAQRMLALSKKENTLQKRVESNGWNRKTVIWEELVAESLEDFPQLTMEDLRRVTIGVYQLKQAASYTREHLTDEGDYILYSHKEEADIVRVRIQSRHTSAKQYQLWIQYENGFDPIKGWYCQCKNGARTVGCCAHIASVLWYLGFYRHLDSYPKYHSDKYPEYELDAGSWSESDDSDGLESEEED